PPPRPGRGPLHAPVAGAAPRQFLRRPLRLELRELELLLREEPTRLQLEQRRHEHEELAAGVEIEPPLLLEALAEREHDLGDVDLGRLQLLSEHERQQQVERPLERTEVELEPAHDPRRKATAATGRAPSAPPWPGRSARRAAARRRPRPARPG